MIDLDEESFRLKSNLCCYFVSRKKRYCKMLVSKGHRYCGQHLVNDTTSNIKGIRRIPCPLDPKHSCFEHKLKQHLDICNAKEKSGMPFLQKGINQGELHQDLKQIHLNDLSDAELLEFINKIRNCFNDHVIVEKQIKRHQVLEDFISKSNFGPSANRHLKQNSSILGHLADNCLLNRNSSKTKAYVEFGSGRGQLTNWLVHAAEDKENSRFILLDKGAQRYKCDSKLKYNKEVNIQRIRIDIQDLILSKIEGFEEDTSVVAFGKHLCGAATDFSLRCLTQPSGSRIDGVVIALCCHHRCTWQSYTGKEFLKNLGFTTDDFSILISLSSWAVSGSRIDKPKNETINDSDHLLIEEQENLEQELVAKENRYKKLGLTVEVKEEIGRKVKQLLDTGRVEYLKKFNFHSKLVQYVEVSDTLENIALIAVPNIICDIEND